MAKSCITVCFTYSLRVVRVTAGLAESNGSLPSGFITHVTCRLTAKNRDQLGNPLRSVIEYGLHLHLVPVCGDVSPYFQILAIR